MTSWFVLILGVCANAFASVLVKIAVTSPRELPSLSNPVSTITNWPLWLGLLSYGAAFMLYSLTLTRLPLNVAHPIMTTGAVAMVVILSIIVFKEQFYWTTGIGLFFVVAGIALISYQAG